MNFKHGAGYGGKKTKTYKIWKHMNDRCNNPNSTQYQWYGGRGISIDQRWGSYNNFLDDMGECPNNLTLDRIDTNGNYCLANCRWATRAEQALGRNNTYKFNVGSKVLTVFQLADKYNVHPETIRSKCRKKLSHSQIIIELEKLTLKRYWSNNPQRGAKYVQTTN